jgi:hypothetical protein
MSVGQTSQVLGSRLKESTLGIQYLQKTEFPQFKSFAGGLIGATGARHDFALQGLRFNNQRF